jgi:hypothetical protein
MVNILRRFHKQLGVVGLCVATSFTSIGLGSQVYTILKVGPQGTSVLMTTLLIFTNLAWSLYAMSFKEFNFWLFVPNFIGFVLSIVILDLIL